MVKRVIKPEMADLLPKIFNITEDFKRGHLALHFDDEAPLPEWAAGLHRKVFENVAWIIVFSCMKEFHDNYPSMSFRGRQSEQDFIDFISTEIKMFRVATVCRFGLTEKEIVMAKLMGEDAFKGSELEKKLSKWFNETALECWIRIHDQLLIVA